MEDEKVHMMGVTEVCLALFSGLVFVVFTAFNNKHINNWGLIVLSILLVLSAILFIRNYKKAPMPTWAILAAVAFNGIIMILITYL